MKVKTINKKIVTKNKSLSIQFSLDGFSFCVLNEDHTKEIIHFSEYTFSTPVATPEALLQKIESIFKTETALQQDFSSIKAIHQNQLSTLVPTPFFDENNLKTYLDYNIKTLPTDFIAFDELKNTNAKNVYVPYVNINNFLFQNFGEFEYQHHATVLIDKLLQQNKNSTEEQLFVNVSASTIDIVALKNGKLLLYNTHKFNSKEDFIYYILFTTEQLSFNNNKFSLTFLGTIEEDTELYKTAYTYIKNITFFAPKEESIFSNATEFSNHSNFILAS